MGLTVQALKAFKEKGFSVNSRINKKDRRQAVTLKHAMFSGYIKYIDDFADAVKDFVERGCIVQPDCVKGYLQFSYPSDQGEVFNDFRNTLYETGNRLRFIGYSDRLVPVMKLEA